MTNQDDNNNLATPREGETDAPISFRAHRLFSIGADWYFSTREGIDQGPYFTKVLAENAIERYIREMQY